MLNHVSIRCEEFKDYMEKGEISLSVPLPVECS